MNQTEELEEWSRLFEDYENDNLGIKEREAFEQRLKEDDAFMADYRRFQNTQAILASMANRERHSGLSERVSATIHKRSGGRFFGRRRFGDKIPFELLTLVVLVLAFLLMMVLRSSDLGNLEFGKESKDKTIQVPDRLVVPKP